MLKEHSFTAWWFAGKLRGRWGVVPNSIKMPSLPGAALTSAGVLCAAGKPETSARIQTQGRNVGSGGMIPEIGCGDMVVFYFFLQKDLDFLKFRDFLDGFLCQFCRSLRRNQLSDNLGPGIRNNFSCSRPWTCSQPGAWGLLVGWNQYEREIHPWIFMVRACQSSLTEIIYSVMTCDVSWSNV